jgi:hypothetical protein
MDHLDVYVAIAVQTLALLGGGAVMVLRNSWSTQDMKEDMKGMAEDLKKLTEVIITQAVQTTRLDNQGSQLAVLQREVSDLRRGVGWKIGKQGEGNEYP